MAIQLVTFGGLHAVDDTGELERLLGQHSRAALFVYMAVERRVSREALTALFWPESDAENARHALRQSLYQLRKAVGSDWIDSRAHELVVTGDVQTDAHAFEQALERGDIESAVELYRGPFLDGVHLVDLQGWESWVDGRRAQYGRAFRKACRELIDARRAAGDLTGAIKVAEQWTARDPSDDEAQHRLIEALAAAGERAEAIRAYETYVRRLEPDGLRPLDETVELAEQLRSDSPQLPNLRLATVPAQQPVPLPPPAERVPEPTAVSTRRPRWQLAAAAIALVALSGSIIWWWALRGTHGESAPEQSTTPIAVLPFSVRGSESAAYLRAGMVNLLGAALDGAGSLRPVDTRAVFAAVAEAGDSVPDPQHGDRVAARLGARKFVLGDVVEAAGQLQIEGAVYDVGSGCAARRAGGLGSCPPPEPSTRAVVNGPADSIFALVDRLAARLLGGLGDPAAGRLLRTASVTTTSLSAFKAYLQGEGLMRAGRFEQAADAYLAAVAQDSTFAVAHYRLGLAREWAPLPGIEDAANAAGRHAARLSGRDRMLLEAFREWRAGRATQAERLYRATLARYPEDVDAWFQLGEILFHHGPLLGRPIAESEEAWRKVLSYEPQNLFAVTHLARMAVVGGDTSALDSLLAPFTSEELRTDRRLTELVLLQAVSRADTTAAHALATDVRRWEPPAVWRVAAFLTAFGSDPALMRGVIRDLLEDYPSSGLRADLYWFTSLLDLAGGRAAAARAARAEAVEAERATPAERRRPGFDAATEWFAATLPLPYPDSTLIRVRRYAALAETQKTELRAPFEGELGIGAPIRLEPLRQYTLGVLALRLRDTTAAAAAAATLERLAAASDATVFVRDLDRGLRAGVAWQRGRGEEALRLLEGLEARDTQGDIAATPFVARANERFLHAEVLASLGRDAEALRWFASLGYGSVSEVPLRAPSHLRQAEIHERLGQREAAVRDYARFLDLWREADAEFQPLVDGARRRLAKLTRPGRP